MVAVWPVKKKKKNLKCIFCFSVNWAKLSNPICLKLCPVNSPVDEATPVGHEDDSQSLKNDGAQESETKSFILPLSEAQTSDLS